MKTVDIKLVHTKRNPIMVYDESPDLIEFNKPCQEKIDKANYMLKNNNVFDAVKAIKAKEKV